MKPVGSSSHKTHKTSTTDPESSETPIGSTPPCGSRGNGDTNGWRIGQTCFHLTPDLNLRFTLPGPHGNRLGGEAYVGVTARLLFAGEGIHFQHFVPYLGISGGVRYEDAAFRATVGFSYVLSNLRVDLSRLDLGVAYIHGPDNFVGPSLNIRLPELYVLNPALSIEPLFNTRDGSVVVSAGLAVELTAVGRAVFSN